MELCAPIHTSSPDPYPELELDLDVPPPQVRLRPKSEDGYVWRVDPAKQHLFQKGLSKLSTGAYMELISGVGVSFHAISAAADAPSLQHLTEAKADSLQLQNDCLREKLEYWRSFAESEGRARLAAEGKLQRSQQTLVKVGERYKRAHVSLMKITRATQEYLDQVHKSV